MSIPLPTFEDFFDAGARELLARSATRPPGKRVTERAVYTTGTNVNSLLAGAAAMADEVMRHQAIRYAGLFLDSSEDSDVDRLVADHYDASLLRKQPSRAIVPLVFRRSIPPSDGAAFRLGSGEIVRTETGIEFALRSDLYLPSNSVGPVTVEAEALVAGTVGNVDERTITVFSKAPTDKGLTVSNEEAATGGDDVELSRDFVARARLVRSSARGGTSRAVKLGALSVSGVKFCSVVEEVDSEGRETGLLIVHVADVAGRANSLLIKRVKAALVDYRCAGAIPYVLGSSTLQSSITYSVGFVDGSVDRAAAAAQLRALTVASVNALAPGETLQRSMLFAIARNVGGLVVSDDSIVAPAADLEPTVNQSIRTRGDLVTVNG